MKIDYEISKWRQTVANLKQRIAGLERKAAPLKKADDAIEFVNDGYDIDQSADYIVSIMKKTAETMADGN